MIENNISTLGFISVPVKELIYYGEKEFGSKIIDKDKIISEIRYKKASGICRVVTSKSNLNKGTKQFINIIRGEVKLIQASSSLKFIKIAKGSDDINLV